MLCRVGHPPPPLPTHHTNNANHTSKPSEQHASNPNLSEQQQSQKPPQEGRSARVQNLFYNEELLGRGTAAGGSAGAPPSLPSAIKTDLLSPSAPLPSAPAAGNPPYLALPLQDAACLAAQAPPTSSTAPVAAGGGVLGGSGASAGVGEGGGGSADGGAGVGGGGGGGGVVDAAGGLGDVNWSDDDALDAMVDDIGREVDGKRLRERNDWLPGLVWLVCWFGAR